jgi:hypothetical protein
MPNFCPQLVNTAYFGDIYGMYDRNFPDYR